MNNRLGYSHKIHNKTTVDVTYDTHTDIHIYTLQTHIHTYIHTSILINKRTCKYTLSLISISTVSYFSFQQYFFFFFFSFPIIFLLLDFGRAGGGIVGGVSVDVADVGDVGVGGHDSQEAEERLNIRSDNGYSCVTPRKQSGCIGRGAAVGRWAWPPRGRGSTVAAAATVVVVVVEQWSETERTGSGVVVVESLNAALSIAGMWSWQQHLRVSRVSLASQSLTYLKGK